MPVEFIWVLGGVLLGLLALWIVSAVKQEIYELDEWWTPRDPSTVARRDAAKLLREANK